VALCISWLRLSVDGDNDGAIHAVSDHTPMAVLLQSFMMAKYAGL
jgi:hypothetical protein